MKLFVTQGHEKGIGLEVFFKTALFLDQAQLDQICLIASEDAIKSTLSHLHFSYTLTPEKMILASKTISLIVPPKKPDFSQSLSALDLGMALAKTHKGILYTLPTSKDQFKGHNGHTEYFRHIYQKSLGMFFSSNQCQMLLVSDHTPIKELPTLLTEERILGCLRDSFESLGQWNWPVGEIFIAGLNPHAGEGGLIGDEDTRIKGATQKMKISHNLVVQGPFAADSMMLQKKSPLDVFVYLYHDQGLGLFKGLSQFMGSNITLGLPYPRFSPDHGTSFSLFGKNTADYRGCQFSLGQALAQLKRMGHG